MSDNDLIRRGDAVVAAQACPDSHWGPQIAAAIAALPAVTPDPDAQVMEDALLHGIGIVQNGKRIDPQDFFAQPDAAAIREAALREAAHAADEHTFGGPAVRDAILALIGKEGA